MNAAALLSTCVALAAASCTTRTRAQEAMAYVEMCAPGRSFDACDDVLSRTDLRRMFPVGGLLGMRFSSRAAIVYPLEEFSEHSFDQVRFDYTMMPTEPAALEKALEAELGPPSHGRAPALGRTIATDTDLYWLVEDGVWVFSSVGVADWYSLPLEGFDAATFNKPKFEGGSRDTFVRPAPKSAAVWRKIGRLLIEQRIK